MDGDAAQLHLMNLLPPKTLPGFGQLQAASSATRLLSLVQMHLGENLGRQGLCGTLCTLRLSPGQHHISSPLFTASVPASPAQGCAKGLRLSLAQARDCRDAAQARGPRGGKPHQDASWQWHRGKFRGRRLGSSPGKAEGQARSNCVSCWAAATQLISAQPGLPWRVELPTCLPMQLRGLKLLHVWEGACHLLMLH